jgi:hypothetical protein
MTFTRYTYLALLLLFIAPSILHSQGTGGGGDAVLGLPVIECRLETNVDSLFFVDNDYSPNTIRATVYVKNISPDTAIARVLTAFLVADTRFNIIGLVEKPVADSLMPGEEASVSFDLEVAEPRALDGLDELRSLITSLNANSISCTHSVWVEHEYQPNLDPICPGRIDLMFDDGINDYVPNPFEVIINLGNLFTGQQGEGDGDAKTTTVQFIGTRGVTLYDQDVSIKDLGTLAPNERKEARFQLVPVRRTNDTTITVCFYARTVGGYKDKKYVDSCCVEVFIPAAKEAAYDIQCNIVPDRIIFQDHKYVPDPFTYEATVTNIGNAIGKNVSAYLQPPKGISLASGEVVEKSLGDIPVGESRNVTWLLTPLKPRFVIDTAKICMSVDDEFGNTATCCDSVIIDSMRQACFDVSCVSPDSLIADSEQGVYTPNPFTVSFTVCNVCSDYADSLRARIIIQDPDVTLITGERTEKTKLELSGTDSLGVDSCFTFEWTLFAKNRAQDRAVPIKFEAIAPNAKTASSLCSVFVPKIDAPSLFVRCEVNADTLHFDPATGGYFPPRIILTVYATNEGGGVAENVTGELAPPPRVLLDTGEDWVKTFTPADIRPNETSVAQWTLVPIKRYDFGALIDLLTTVKADNIIETYTAPCEVFIPALPRTAAMTIPRNLLGYTDQTVMVPIFIDDPSGKDIKSIEAELAYNVRADGTRTADDILEFQEVITLKSLAQDWNVVSQGRNPTNDALNFHIVTGDDTPLAYPPEGQVVLPLIWLKFRAVYGNRPNDLNIEQTEVQWPGFDEVQDKVVINNGSIFPRVADGLVTISGDCLRPLTASGDYVINQNRPNPFNPTTTIEFEIPVDDNVRISVFDALGREVAVLLDQEMTAGAHAVIFNADNLPSGIYFYRMETPHFTQMRKMVVAK